MQNQLWDGFRNTTTGDTIPEADVWDSTATVPYIKSPNVLQATRDHFNCPTAPGLPLQTTSTSHWHMKYVFSPLIFTNKIRCLKRNQNIFQR